ncbi:MAG: copper ion binding protein [Oscillospiraceae bacterium]|jgi:copper chaperone|nr:copper ion binding protein [Oscillospiraceae bacterium]
MANDVINVEGMSCEHCVKAVTIAVSALPGVENVSVDLDGGKVSVTYDPALSALDAIKSEITEQGYDVVA